MANPNHVEIAKKGSSVINDWKKKCPKEHLDLTWADLNRADLSRANLYMAKLFMADLSRANLSYRFTLLDRKSDKSLRLLISISVSHSKGPGSNVYKSRKYSIDGLPKHS